MGAWRLDVHGPLGRHADPESVILFIEPLHGTLCPLPTGRTFGQYSFDETDGTFEASMDLGRAQELPAMFRLHYNHGLFPWDRRPIDAAILLEHLPDRDPAEINASEWAQEEPSDPEENRTIPRPDRFGGFYSDPYLMTISMIDCGKNCRPMGYHEAFPLTLWRAEPDYGPGTDVERPHLVSWSYEPESVRPGETVEFVFHVVDNDTGIRAVDIAWRREGRGLRPFDLDDLAGVSRYDAGRSEFRYTITIPEDSAEGQWRLDYFAVTDHAGNSKAITQAPVFSVVD